MRRLNMKMWKQMVIASAVLLGSTAAFADGRGGMRSHDGCGMDGRVGAGLAQKLGLNAAQQSQVSDLKATLDAQVAPACGEMRVKYGELRTLWSAPSPDRDAILAKQAEIDPLRQTVRAAHVDFRIGLQNVLTPAQRAQAAALRAKVGHRGGPHGAANPSAVEPAADPG